MFKSKIVEGFATTRKQIAGDIKEVVPGIQFSTVILSFFLSTFVCLLLFLVIFELHYHGAFDLNRIIDRVGVAPCAFSVSSIWALVTYWFATRMQRWLTS